MTLKCDAKFKEKLTCDLKNDIRNLVKYHTSSQMSENLMGSFCPKYIMFEQNNYTGVMCQDTEG